MENLEEKLREAACFGDRESVEKILSEDIDINCKHKVNGWTPLHWACKREHLDIVKLLLQHGADPKVLSYKNESPADVCSNPTILDILRVKQNLSATNNSYSEQTFVTNFKNLAHHIGKSRFTHPNISYMPTTTLPSMQEDALEDWLYKNFNLKNHQLLLLWQSDPCVVIGRHQNPFLEANVSDLRNITQNGVILSRRNSGGGTVYHDHGNLNLSFLTIKECYNRRHNLEIITRAISKEYGFFIDINQREDLVVDDNKVSGTAAKLGRPNAYHHCTLLVNVNKNDLSRSLKRLNLNIETNAMTSVRSKIMNLVEIYPAIEISNLMKAIGIEYMRTPAFQGLNKETCPNIPQGFKYVEPSEENYPGISEIQEHFSSWFWIFGKTPKFNIKYDVDVSQNLSSSNENFVVILYVDGGFICKVDFIVPSNLNRVVCTDDINKMLMHKVFDLDIIEIVEEIVARDCLKLKYIG